MGKQTRATLLWCIVYTYLAMYQFLRLLFLSIMNQNMRHNLFCEQNKIKIKQPRYIPFKLVQLLSFQFHYP